MSVPVRIGFILLVTLATTAVGIAIIVLMPADHFVRRPSERARTSRSPLLRWTLIVLRNLLGILVLPLGIVMALPLVPGPGLVFILIGLSLVSFPGKRKLERALITRPSVHRFVNQARERYGRPPFQLE